MHPKKWPPAVKTGLILITLGSIIFSAVWNFGSLVGFFGLVVSILKPVFIGFSIAFVLYVPMSKFEKLLTYLFQKTNCKISVGKITAISLLLSLALVSTVVFLIIWYVLPHLVDSIKTAANSLRNNYPLAIEYLEAHGINVGFINESFNPSGLVNYLEENINQILKLSYSAVSTVISSVFTYFTAFILAIYMLVSKHRLKSQFKRLLSAALPEHVAGEITSVLRIAYRCFSNFIAGQCMEAVILGLLFYVTLSILNIPYAFLLSVLIGICALIPYVGAFLGFFVGAIMILFIDPFKAMIFAITFIILQQLEGQLIYPRVVGKSVGLPPVWTLIAVMIGGQVGGVLGMLLFIPFTAVIYTLVKQYIAVKEQKKKDSEQNRSENMT